MKNKQASVELGFICVLLVALIISGCGKEPKAKTTNKGKVATCGTVDDADGNTYNTVKIGGQCWMKENLNYDGDPAGNGCKDITWVTGSDKGWCGYYTGGPYTDEGLFYQWSAAMNGSTTPGAQGLCPPGWHIPTHDEFTTLEREVCTSRTCTTDFPFDATDFPFDTTTICSRGTDEGKKLKSGGTSGFDALLAGHRNSDGSYYNRGTNVLIWSSSPDGGNAWTRLLYVSCLNRLTDTKASGFSVRCLKD